MSSLAYQVTVYVGKEVYTKHFSPDETVAQQTAHWHLSQGATFVEVLNRQTKEKKKFTRDGDTIFSEDTGEEIYEAPGIRLLTIQVAGLEKALRGERLAHAKTRAEKEKEMEDSPEFEDVNFLFAFWRRIHKHPRAVLDLARYRNVLPHLKKEGVEMCARAIAGKAWDNAHPASFKKGDDKIYDDWELIFRDRSHFERYCNIAPKNWKELYQYDNESN